MKQLMIFSTILILLSFGCKKDELNQPDICATSCENETITEEIVRKEGKIIKVNDVYCITTDIESFNKEGYIIGSENILVPCILEDEYKITELRVIVSGYKSSCCDLLTLPQLRTSFGCKFDMTSIEALESDIN